MQVSMGMTALRKSALCHTLMWPTLMWPTLLWPTLLWSTLVWRLSLWLTLVAVLLSCGGCANPVVSHPDRFDTTVVSNVFAFRDGGSALFHVLDKRLEAEPPDAPATLLFFISGSGCASMRRLLPNYFDGLEGESGSLRIYILQKRFIKERNRGREDDCSDDFVTADHPARWVADQAEFIRAHLPPAVASGDRPPRIVIAGASEGGEIAPVLAHLVPGVTHLVIIGNGGMDPLDAYRLQLARHGEEAAGATLSAALAKLPADPDAPVNRLAGRSWRYWFELAGLRHTDNLLGLTIPIWLGFGEADQAVPLESVRYLQHRFALLGKTNLTVKTYVGADHGLKTNSHANLSGFWFLFDRYMRK